MMNASYRFNVTGRVQGVGFRYTAVQEARRQGLTGWVRNREDGSVEGLAQGEQAALDRFRAWLQQGPSLASVDRVEWIIADGEDLPGFETRR